MAAHTQQPFGTSEFDFVGGLRGRPLEVIKGPLTGLPIPAYAEIAIEGEVPPPTEESRAEGPFGEWPGYYSGGTIGTGEAQPVIRVKAVYFRNDPIIVSEAPLWPGASIRGLPLQAGLLWDQLENAGIQDIAGVYNHTRYLLAVSIRQRYAGHAKRAGLIAAANSYMGRLVVVVDDDVDPSNLADVMWAVTTRCEPAEQIDIVRNAWSSALDPRIPAETKAAGITSHSKAIIEACRPFGWIDKFPPTSALTQDEAQEIEKKWGGAIKGTMASKLKPPVPRKSKTPR
jgi:3-polyprenyl-4-hydroxybenzoate decarboxylase and related decarboxylases